MRKRRRYKKTSPLFFIIILFLILSFVYVDKKIRPIAREYCVNEIEFFALDAMNQAVSIDMEENRELYTNIAILNRGDEINAVTTDTYKINKIKTNIMQKSDDIFNEMVIDEVNVPLGALNNNLFLYTMGIDLPVKMIPMSTVNVDFASSFESVGINQSLHKIIMECKVDIKILLPYDEVNFEVCHKLAICETLILGNVPESYTHIDDISPNALDNYNHYAN